MPTETLAPPLCPGKLDAANDRLGRAERLVARCREALQRMDPDTAEGRARPFGDDDYDALRADLDAFLQGRPS